MSDDGGGDAGREHDTGVVGGHGGRMSVMVTGSTLEPGQDRSVGDGARGGGWGACGGVYGEGTGRADGMRGDGVGI